MNTRAQRSTDGCDKGVSPLVGEALFVCIVLVLGGCLSYFILLDRHVGGPVDYPLKTTLRRTVGGNWAWTIDRGRTDDNASIIVKGPRGSVELARGISVPSRYFVFNDNNGDGFLDAGDVILLNQTAGTVEPGWAVEIIGPGASFLTGQLTLPE